MSRTSSPLLRVPPKAALSAFTPPAVMTTYVKGFIYLCKYLLYILATTLTKFSVPKDLEYW